ncbi:hypothetical protein QYE76_053708 [Lolium multiflorum]|uniref:Uncharacterized protein n=1 Tax=Lolium multiflorum TaxID=4521 RepID=A0AAD8SXE2_LOLMU|nr:hypothetical protein QYE76_053708 [Lolium multiflorum]
MEKEGNKAASAASAVLHAEKAEAEASVTASVVEQLVKEPSVEEPEVEDLKKGGAEEMVAVADLEKGVGVVAREDLEKPEAETVVGEEGGAGVAAPVLPDLVDQKAEVEAEAEVMVAEEGVAVDGPPVVADDRKGKEEVVMPEAEVEDAYTAWVAGGKKRKFGDLGEPVYPSDSEGSLDYDSTDSDKSVDKRNVGSFKRKLLEQLRGGSLRYLKYGHYTCLWHARKPKCGSKKNLKQHATELSRTGTSARIRARIRVELLHLAGKPPLPF